MLDGLAAELQNTLDPQPNLQGAQVTYDGSTMKVYIDGVEDTGGDFPFSASGNINNPPATAQIGRDEYGVDKYFDGLIDEVRVYKRSMSAQAVQKEYDSKQKLEELEAVNAERTTHIENLEQRLLGLEPGDLRAQVDRRVAPPGRGSLVNANRHD